MDFEACCTQAPSVIKENEGYLGVFDHPAKLKKGDGQHFIFRPPNPGENFPGDVGPWWMDDNEREATRHDRTVCSRPRDKTIKMLKEQLAPLVELDNRRSYRLKELEALASENNIDKRWNAPVIEKGWEGKPKGLKQVLWERGFIDESIPLDEYTIMPSTNDDDDEDAEDYSLLLHDVVMS